MINHAGTAGIAREVIGPGLYPQLSDTTYHADPALGSGDIKELMRSPLHWKWKRDLGGKDTPALRFGRIYHAAILEPARFAAEYAAAPDVDRRTTDGKAAFARFQLEARDKQIITADELARVQAMALVMRRHPAARWLLGGPGLHEVSGFWIDANTGVRCKLRADRLRDDGIVVDLKTCESAAPDAAARACANYRYHWQEAHYRDGLAALGREVRAWVFLFQESEPPYAVAAYTLDPAAVELGRVERGRALARYLECQAADRWPGYGDDVAPLNLPSWVYRGAEIITPTA